MHQQRMQNVKQSTNKLTTMTAKAHKQIQFLTLQIAKTAHKDFFCQGAGTTLAIFTCHCAASSRIFIWSKSFACTIARVPIKWANGILEILKEWPNINCLQQFNLIEIKLFLCSSVFLSQLDNDYLCVCVGCVTL